MNGPEELFDALVAQHPASLDHPVRVSLVVEGWPLVDRVMDAEVAAEVGTQLALAVSERLSPERLIHVFSVPVPARDPEPTFPLPVKLIHSCKGIAHNQTAPHHNEETAPL